MNDIVNKISQIALAIWLRRWVALGIAWLVAILGAVWISFMADRYEATAKVYVDTQTVLKPLMNGLAFQPDIEQQVSMLAKTLISRPNVERIADALDIGYHAKRDREVDRLMKEIKIAPASSNLYAVSYRDVDPKRAQKVVQSLVDLFVNAGVGDNRKDSEDARRFIDEQIHTYEFKLSESENRLKEFKLQNFGLVGSGKDDYFARASALSDAVAKVRMDLSAAENSRDALRRELSTEEPQLPADTSQPSAVPSESAVRLDAMKRQLDDLLRRYTDEHPDVVAARRSIAQMEKQRQAELSASKGSARGAATSPVYQKIRISLAEAEANVASLRTQMSVQQSRLDEIRAKAGKMPETEAQLAQLNRDYEVLKRNYEQLVARRESAFLGVKLDQSSQMADFRMVEPPRVGRTPVAPGRQMLAVLSLPLAILIGLAAVGGFNQLRPTLHGADDLMGVSGRPVIGSLSMVVTPQARRLLYRDYLLFAVAFGVMVVSQSVWIVWIINHSGF